MATVNKDFKIKNGLVVEGTNATVNGNQILTENAGDQYILDLVGGVAYITSVDANDFSVTGGELAVAAGSDLARTGDIPTTTDEISEGVNNEYYTDAKVRDVLTTSTQTNITITEVGNELHITAENGVADSTTDDLTEGTSNKYFSTSLVDNHLSGGDGISYSQGVISADLDGAGGLGFNQGTLGIDRTTVDTWYDASGAASTVAGNLTTHEGLTSGVHGVTGSVVGTTDIQDLSNKTIIDTLSFSDGVTIAQEGEIAVKAVTHEFEVKANDGDLHLITIATGADVNITAEDGSIVLNAGDGAAYYGSASAENEIATHGYVDNAISGLDWKQSVNLLSNANVSDLTDTTLTIDGHSVDSNHTGYRILLTSQTTDSENGIYEVVNGAFPGTISLSRPADADAYTELIGAAVYVMEGTQYGSTSWVQGDHYLTDFSGQDWTQFSGQGSVTAGTGITVDGLEVSVNRTTVDTWYDPAGSADTVQGNLEDHAADTATHGVTEIVGASEVQTLTNKTINGQFNTIQNIGNSSLVNNSITVNGYSTALGDSVTLNTDDVAEIANATNKYYTDARVENVITNSLGVGGDIKSAIDSATPDSTDDLPEGVVNHYYTDARAKAEAAALLTNATQNNITITADANNNLTITAENGVADSTTDDLTEGSTNLYFTDSRALGAVSGADITPNTVTIDTYRKEEATQQYVASTSTVNVHSIGSGFESVKYLVRVVGDVSGTKHSQLTEILMTVDGAQNIAITEYGTICTNTTNLATFSAAMVGPGAFAVPTLTATTAVNGCEIIAAATMLSWAD